MKKLTQVSLVLFITALSFSSCEEDNVLRERSLNEAGTELINSENGSSENVNEGSRSEVDGRVEETKNDR